MNGLRITAIELTNEARSEIIRTALDAGHVHGIGYWAEVKKVEDRRDALAVLIEDVERAGTTDGAEGSRFKDRHEAWIDGDDIAMAVCKMLLDPVGSDSTGWTEQLIEDSLDGPLADAIIQVACFGKVIYG